MIPLDSIDLNTVLINPPCFEKLDTVNGKFKRQQNSTEAKPKAHCPLTGECPGKGRCHCVDPGAFVEEKFSFNYPIFKKPLIKTKTTATPWFTSTYGDNQNQQ
jgi:hypothetical protein